MSEAVMRLRVGEREPWGAILFGAGTFAVGLALGVFAPGVPRSTPPCAAAGQALAATAAGVAVAPEVRTVPTPGHFYVVTKGTTLSDVSKRAYGTTLRVADLVAANPGIEPARLKPASFLYVPVGSEPAPSALPASVAQAGPPR